jgi:hypothetical protein
VPVPLLSELRKLAGQDPYITNAREKIQRLLASGYIPPGEVCVMCGLRTAEVWQCTAACERKWVERRRETGNSALMALRMIFSPLTMALASFTRSADGEDEMQVERGRDVVVKLPLRLCQNCREKRLLAKAEDLRRALGRVPEYAELLKEYPDAELSSL